MILHKLYTTGLDVVDCERSELQGQIVDVMTIAIVPHPRRLHQTGLQYASELVLGTQVTVNQSAMSKVFPFKLSIEQGRSGGFNIFDKN
jgi:hypothetical protein